jgi:hypothetical protein
LSWSNATPRLAALPSSGKPMRRELAALATVLALTACGAVDDDAESPPTQGAGLFVIQGIKWALEGDAKPLWLSLHPAHRRVFGLRKFIECSKEDIEDGGPIPEGLKFQVLMVVENSVEVPGVGRLPGAAVKVRLSGGGEEATPTATVVKAQGRWRTFLGPKEYERARRGQCP